jgi:hypothetical protein
MDPSQTLIAIGLWDSSHGRLLDVQARAALADRLSQTPRDKLTQRALRSAIDHAAGKVGVNAQYVRGLAKSLAAVAAKQRPGLEVVLQAFRLEARRSAGPIFRLDQFRHEEVGRTLILFFLKQRSYPEARSGAGRVDLVLVEPLAVIEVKVVPTSSEVASGLEQLADYMESESRLDDSAEGYFVVFSKDKRPVWWKTFGDGAVVNGRSIKIIWVEIPTKAPSKLGTTR